MRQNVDPKQWGPQAWSFLRHCATACDESSGPSYKSFLELLPSVLPCEQCREHSGAYIAENPVDTGDLVGWVERFRRAVSQRKGSGGGASPPVPAESGSCSGCAGAAKLRMALLVLGATVACVAVVLLVVGLVKLTKAGRIK